jgi:hypothetical protein
MLSQTRSTPPRADRFARRIGYLGVLIALVAAHVLVPALSGKHVLLGLMRFAGSAVLLLAVVFARRSTGELALAGGLIAVALGAELGGEGWHFVAAAARLSFMLLIAALVLRELSSHAVVNVGTISGAFIVYLLIADAFAESYDLVDRATPDAAFVGITTHRQAVTLEERLARRADFAYFSLVTMTTLGYGDVAPRAPLARSLATIEALFGQAYLAVMIARLVSLYRPGPPPDVAGRPGP